MRPLVLAAILTPLLCGSAMAQESELLPLNVTFAISTGFWEGDKGTLGLLDKDLTIDAPEIGGDQQAAGAEPKRGYYKLFAVRQADATAKIHLQQIALSPAGPLLVSSIELEEFSAIKAYVTDIRPESSAGVAASPGLFATVYLKTQPTAQEPESWTVLIDDLGELKVERATN